jgi:hypothetical protein
VLTVFPEVPRFEALSEIELTPLLEESESPMDEIMESKDAPDAASDELASVAMLFSSLAMSLLLALETESSLLIFGVIWLVIDPIELIYFISFRFP